MQCQTILTIYLPSAQKIVEKHNGGAPEEIGRIDSPNTNQPNSQWHAHQSKGKRGGTNFDGSPHDGGHEWGKKAKEYLKNLGFDIE